ncbi:MAG: gluconate 2-dehydrogenase subunit 3 family protein, partial [Longimicrobiales bacterium]|nr:gluconate 2-dehydrogenase subunit 3 family protein [Longimicrobiales bacterium]
EGLGLHRGAAGFQEHRMSAERKLPVVGSSGGLPMDRRHALKVMALAAGGPALAAACGPGAPPDDLDVPAPTSNPRAAGTAWDPDLVSPSVPWERTLTETELAALAVLCDVILPADERSPSASEVGAHDFIDEWVSAPYDANERDLVRIRGGLIWLDRESERRFGTPDPETSLRFADLTVEQQHEICDDICYEPQAPEGYESAARFFDRVRYLTSTAFWTTTEGMDDLEYVGNVPLQRWDPPPPEVLRHIGLE